MNSTIKDFLESNSGTITDLAHEVFLYAETAEEEVKSQDAFVRFFKEHGFFVETGVGGMSTSVRAQWGNGSPVIGFLGEYDALPELDQQAVPYRCGNPEKSGHGCGHNLLGTGAAAAAVALAAALREGKCPGTVVFYGCPAEEILKGKVVMLKNGCFRDLDAAITWHPGMENKCGELAYLAMDSMQFFFHGKAAHASAAPHKGRSALDACELMNVGVNYLREHVTDDVRIHYAHLPGNHKPNIVPAEAGVWYFVRGRQRETVDDVTQRVIDCAKGAALMTSTDVDWKFLSRGYGTNINFALCQLMHDTMVELGHPGFSEEEKEFARTLSVNMGSSAELGELDETFDQPTGKTSYMTGSTDVSDVSQVVPTVNIRMACGPRNIVLHSWQYAACADSDIGRKGMLFAAHVMAQAGWKLATEPDTLHRVQSEFDAKTPAFRDLI